MISFVLSSKVYTGAYCYQSIGDYRFIIDWVGEEGTVKNLKFNDSTILSCQIALIDYRLSIASDLPAYQLFVDG